MNLKAPSKYFIIVMNPPDSFLSHGRREIKVGAPTNTGHD